jgi:hypothetical protein
LIESIISYTSGTSNERKWVSARLKFAFVQMIERLTLIVVSRENQNKHSRKPFEHFQHKVVYVSCVLLTKS